MQHLIGSCWMHCYGKIILDYRSGIIDSRWLWGAFIKRVFELKEDLRNVNALQGIE